MRHKQCYLFIFSASSDNKRFVSRKRLIISLSVFLLFWRWIKIKGTNTKKKRIKEIGSDIFYPLVLNLAPNETVEKPKLEKIYIEGLFIPNTMRRDAFFAFRDSFDSFNGRRYWHWGGRGLCLEAGKTRSQKNARKCRRIPSVQCMLCWAVCLFTQALL